MNPVLWYPDTDIWHRH